MIDYFIARTGRKADVEEVVLPPSAGTTITADTTSDSYELGDRASLRLTLTVSDINVADDLDVTIEGSQDNTNWFALGTFAQVTAATSASETKVFPCARFVRANYDKTGVTASATATVTGEAA